MATDGDEEKEATKVTLLIHSMGYCLCPVGGGGGLSG